MLTDSHCHFQDKKLAPDLDQVIDRARNAGVTKMVTIGYDMPSSRRGVEIAAEHNDIFATVGVHPHDARTLTDTDLTTLAQLAESDRVVGIGEIGLDFYRNLSLPEDQYRAFREQLSLAGDLQLPAIIHSRDADEEAFEVLVAYAKETLPQWPAGRPLGVMHCFAGDVPLARRYIELGFVISIAATVTYPTAERTREVAASIPLDRMTIETDAPYLPPQSIRGQRNEPARVRDVAEFVAQIRGIPVEEVAGETAKTAARLYGLG